MHIVIEAVLSLMHCFHPLAPCRFPARYQCSTLILSSWSVLEKQSKTTCLNQPAEQTQFVFHFIYQFILFLFFCVFQADRGEYEANAKRVKRKGGGGEGGAQKNAQQTLSFWLRTEAAQCSCAVMSLLISHKLMGLLKGTNCKEHRMAFSRLENNLGAFH